MNPKSFTYAQFVAWGKQGGLKSTRKLTTEESKRMLAIRERNRAKKKTQTIVDNIITP